MAVPRPVLIALLGLAMLTAVFLATRNSQNESVTPPATPATPAKPAKPAKPANGADKPARPHVRQTQAPKPDSKPVPRKPKLAADVPPQVEKAAAALAQDKVVIFFFTTPGAADDTLSRLAVRSIEGMKGVEFFKADIAEVGAYRPMLSQLEISQIPATVIARPGKRAVLIQGYVD